MKASFAVIEVGSASCRLLVRASSGSIIEDQKFSQAKAHESNITTLTEALLEANKFQTEDIVVIVSSGTPTEHDSAIRKIISTYPHTTFRRLSGNEEAKLGVEAVQLALPVPAGSLIIDLGSSAQLTLTSQVPKDNQVLSFKDTGFNAIQKRFPANELKEHVDTATNSMWEQLHAENPITEVIATSSMPLFMLTILGRYNGNPLKNTGDPLAVTGQRLTMDDLNEVIGRLSSDLEAETLTVTSTTGEVIQLSRKINLAYAYQLKRALELAEVNSALVCTYEWRHAIPWQKNPPHTDPH